MKASRDKAVEIVKVLRGTGHQAYWAGGCVRDLLMGHEPSDYDIASNAPPEKVMKLFPRTFPVGVSFGVVRVMLDGSEFEVATFRSDGQYLDGRHPSEIHFSGEREDAHRRDFTLNGMFYDPIAERVIDYVGGQEDIKRKIIRTIGSPWDRFNEDSLRLIRAARFSARFDFTLDPQTEKAIRELAPVIERVSPERIRDEFEKMLTGPHPAQSIRILRKTGLLKILLPEVIAMEGVEQPPEYHPEGDVWTHTLLLLDEMERPLKGSLPPSFELAMAALLHDVGKPKTFSRRDRIRFDNHCDVGARMSRSITRRWKMSNTQIDRITDLVRGHLTFKDVQKMKQSTLKRFLRQPYFSEHLELHRIDCLASHGDLSHWEFCRDKLSELPTEVIRPPKLITGDDLIGIDYLPGPFFKEILTAVEDAQLEGRIKDRAEALDLVKKKFPQKPVGWSG